MMMTSHDGPDDLNAGSGAHDEWAQAISETPLFKEKLPSVFESLATSLTERSNSASKTKTRKRTRNQRGDNRRVGSWRWFAWSTAMAVVMAMLATIFLHSWVEERATAKAASRIAQMENESRLRIQQDAESLQDLIDDNKRMLRQSAMIFKDIMDVGNIESATLLLYSAARQIQDNMDSMDVLNRYMDAIENLSTIEESLMNLEVPEDFEPAVNLPDDQVDNLME